MKKCLVLDLDNTLWGGVVGEDGFDGIKLGFDEPGASFVAFQQAILDLYNRGVILAINSKNNHEDAMRVIREHPNMVLKEKNFAAARINWIDKTVNMREIASELNIGLDSFVFLDDDPVNREIIRNVLPEVETPEMPENPSEYAKFLMSLPYFQVGAITDEDRMRGNLYVTERLRKASEKNFSSPNEYLKNLELEVVFYRDDKNYVSRLAQLTEKTNQFNMNKTSLTEEAVLDYMGDSNHVVIHVQAKDRFGDYGIIAFALISKLSSNWLIKSMLMSCRALGRGIEEAFIDAIAGHARENGAVKLEILFNMTDKNQPAKDFLDKHFTDYHYDLSKDSIEPSWIKSSWIS